MTGERRLAEPDEKVTVSSSDNHSFSLSLYHEGTPDDGFVLLVFPAMGVRGRGYAPFAQALRTEGYAVAVAELRGHGTSSWRASRKQNFGYREMVEMDWPAACQAVAQRYPQRKLVLLGHSLGGQLSCLFAAANPNQVSGLILIACCSVYYKHWGDRKWGLRGLIAALRPIVWLKGYFPGDRLGFAHREGAQVMLDWGYQAKTGHYRVKGSSVDYEGLLAQAKLPVLMIRMEGDALAPEKPVAHLVGKLKSAAVNTLCIPLGDENAGKRRHFSWMREPEQAVSRIKAWLDVSG